MALTETIFINILSDASKSLSSFAGLAIKVGAVIKVVKEFIKITNESVQAFHAQEMAEAKLAAVLKSTGNAAGLTSRELTNMASAMQQTTTYGDELVINAQAIMATFTKVGKNVFPDAMKAAADLSAVMGQDLQASVVQIGKALNDPIIGVTALRRVGVMLTGQQEEQIKTMMTQNNLFGAQTVILKELQKEFGGAAEAMGNTAAGAAQILTNAIGDLQKAYGKLISDRLGLRDFHGFLTDLAQLITGNVQKTVDLKRAIQDVAKGTISEDMGELEAQFDAAMEKMKEFVAIREVESHKAAWTRKNVDAEIEAWRRLTVAISDQIYVQSGQRIDEEKTAEVRAQASAEQAKIEKDLAQLREAYGKTEAGQREKAIADLEKQIAWFETFTKVTGDNIRIRDSLLKSLKEELALLKEIEAVPSPLSSAQLNELWGMPSEYSGGARPTPKIPKGPAAGVMSDASGGFRLITEGANEAEKAISDLGLAIKEALSNAALEALSAVGASLYQGAEGAKNFEAALGDIMADLLAQAPKLLMMAGLNILATSAGDPFLIGVGLAFLAASGISAIASGYVNASRASTSGAETTAPSGGNYGYDIRTVPSSRMVVNVNVHGTIIEETNLSRSVYAAMARVRRGY